MIEFKRAGDVMVFTCPGFKIEVAGNGAERIEFNRDAINSSSNFIEHITDAFKILDMMIEHKAKQDNALEYGTDIKFDVKRGNPGKVVSEMHVKVNVDTTDAEKTIEQLNHYIWKSELGNNPPGHRFREYMKRRGL